MKNLTTPISSRAVEYILTREIEELGRLTHAWVANALGVNPAYLARQFKKDQNITLPAFIVRIKIHTAIYLLEQDQTISVQALANQLGFSTIQQFNQAFRDYIAVEPTQYQVLKKKVIQKELNRKS